MSEVTLTAVVGEDHVLHLEVPTLSGEVEVVVKEIGQCNNGKALLSAIENLPPRTQNDKEFWKAARQELLRDRDTWDED